jgi:hypothetical protein
MSVIQNGAAPISRTVADSPFHDERQNLSRLDLAPRKLLEKACRILTLNRRRSKSVKRAGVADVCVKLT